MRKERVNKKIDKGYIISFFEGVARLQGLSKVFIHELLLDKQHNPAAIVIGFDNELVEALFFKENIDLEAPIFSSGQFFTIPISKKYIGRTINGLGLPLDELGNIRGKKNSVFQQSPSIINRKSITRPLSTGMKIIDTTIPLGHGQRELIIGDRQLGKSTLALDIVLNQKHVVSPVFCIYVMSGQKKQKIEEVVSLFEKHNAFLYTVIVAASADSSLAEQYLAPFVGCTIGEYFRDRGQDALVIYDDLSKHAKTYRDISLLLERAPGREAYPGDIFSLHAGLLERAAQLSDQQGGGSLTAIPIIETQENDISSFIPTNIISITDGQIYLEQDIFQKGFLPAINIGLSVSRVGSQAQPKLLKEIVGDIRLTLAQHEELQKLSQLETIVNEELQTQLHQGMLLKQLLQQPKHFNISWPEQLILFYAANNGLLDDIPKEQFQQFELLFLELITNRYFELLKKINQGMFNKHIQNKIKEVVEDFKQEFLTDPKNQFDSALF